MKVTLVRPWIDCQFPEKRRVLSFAPYRPGFVMADRILWREVRNADLTDDFDAIGWIGHEVRGYALDAVAMMTSRNVAKMHQARSGAVHVVATVGLGNAERVGHRRHARPEHYGTINIAVDIDAGLTDAALIEALTIAAEARTTAILDVALRLPTGLATGTGTDCIAVASGVGETEFAGLHTALGEDIGRAVYTAVRKGAVEWLNEQLSVPPTG